ncbi:MAG: OmpA family protein [Pseudomonadota bacterium]
MTALATFWNAIVSRARRLRTAFLHIIAKITPGWGFGRHLIRLGRLAASPPGAVFLFVLGFATVGVASVHLGLGPLASAAELEARLADDARRAVGRAVTPWADVAVDGRTARVSGEAPTIIDRERVRRAVADAAGERILAGIADVDVRAVSVAARAQASDPFRLVIARSADGVRLSGLYNDGETLQNIVQVFARRSAAISENSVEAAGRRPGETGRRSALLSARALAFLIRGEAEITADALLFRGAAANPSDASTARAIVESVSSTLRKDIIITVDEPPAPDEAGVCQTRLDAIAADLQEMFYAREATIIPQGAETLDRLGQIVRECRSFSLRIESHVFDVEPSSAASAVSEARADAIVEALIARGVSPGRLEAAGFGDQRMASERSDLAGDRIEIVIAN